MTRASTLHLPRPAETPPQPQIARLALSTSEAAQAIGLSPRTVAELIATGALRSFTVGRRRLISVSAIEAWIAAQEVGA
jgi:excisionase family DNA binding protein